MWCDFGGEGSACGGATDDREKPRAVIRANKGFADPEGIGGRWDPGSGKVKRLLRT